MYFLQEPPEHKVKFAVRRVPAKMVKQILELAATHRAELLQEWERSQSDE